MEDKRRRVAKLLSVSGVTDVALVRILEQLQGQEVPAASRYDCRQAAHNEYDDEVALQLKLPLLAGGSFDWDICNPSALVQRCVRKSAAMRRLFARVPSSPTSPVFERCIRYHSCMHAHLCNLAATHQTKVPQLLHGILTIRANKCTPCFARSGRLPPRSTGEVRHPRR